MTDQTTIKEKLCVHCDSLKPYPGDYITSYIRMTVGSKCADCRVISRKATRIKMMGKSNASKSEFNRSGSSRGYKVEDQ